MMGRMGYNRVIGKKCYGVRSGFKLNTRRSFSVLRLRVKLLCFFRIFRKSLKSSYVHIVRLLKKKDDGSSSNKNLVSRKEADFGLYGNRKDFRLKSYTRSNSFYAEAIADCLDFIKRNSLSIEEKPVLSEESLLEE